MSSRRQDGNIRLPSTPTLVSSSSPRGGMTLIELLVVVGLVTLLAALAATAIRPALENRKTKEASRILVSTFAQAKARASATGRRVGVWLQGADGLGDVNYNYSTELYLAEEPLPYSGDLQSSHAVIEYQAPYAGTGRCWLRKAENALLAIDSDANGLPDEVQIGDRIKFNYRGRSYRIMAVNTGPSDLSSAVPVGPDHTAKFNTPGNFFEIVFALDGYPLPYGTPPPTDAAYNYGAAWGSAGGPLMVRYQFLRQPRRIGRAISLPVGTCVDLRNSGMQRVTEEDTNGNGSLDAGEDLNNNSFRDAWPWGGVGVLPGMEFRLTGGTAAEPTVEVGNATALVVFEPGGQVDIVARNYESVTRSVLTPPDTVHFMIGDLEGVEIAGTLPYVSGGADVAFNQNLVNLESLWVSVNVRNGNVTSANNNWVGLTTFTTSLHGARQFANEAQNLGAR